MKQLLITIAALVLVGCGESQPTTKAPDTRLHKAAWDGDINAVKQYLTAGMDVDAKDADGETPLMNAACVGHKEIVELLIEKRADVNAKSSFGTTPLHEAGYGKETEVAELLIAKGADVNAKDGGGDTPLDEAIKLKRHPEIADLLRKHGGKTGVELKAEGK